MAHMLCELAEKASRALTKDGRERGENVSQKQSLYSAGRYGAMLRQPQFQVSLHVGPFAGEYAVENRVARCAVAARRVMANDAVFLRAQSLNRPLRSHVEIVRPQADH